MYKLIVAFTDGAVSEYMCHTREGAKAHLKTLKHVDSWEIVETEHA